MKTAVSIPDDVFEDAERLAAVVGGFDHVAVLGDGELKDPPDVALVFHDEHAGGGSVRAYG